MLIRDASEPGFAAQVRHPSEGQYRVLFESHPSPVYVFDEKTLQFLAVNEAALRQYGYSREEFLAMNLRDIRPGEDVPALIEAVTRATGRIAFFTGPWRHRIKDGTLIDVEVTTSPVIFEGRGARLALVQNVTKRKRAEAALSDSEQRYRSLFDNSLDAIFTVDAQGRFLTVNRAGQVLSGYSEQELKSLTIAALCVPEFLEKTMQSFLRTLSGGQPEDIETAMYRKGGTRVEVFATGVPMKVGGEIVGVFGIVRDITERKCALEALRTSEELARQRLAEIENYYDMAPIGMCVLNTDLRFVRINERMAEINGRPAADHLGRTIREMVPGLADQAEPILRRVIETGHPTIGVEIDGETEAQPGVRRAWVEDLFPLKNAAGKLIGINVVAAEVTERKRSERERERLLAQVQAERVMLAMHYGIVRVLAGASSVAEAGEEILQSICNNTGWDTGALWRLDETERVLRAVATWCRAEPKLKAFLNATRKVACRVRSGFPGRAWSSGEPVWVADAVADPRIVRAKIAAKCGLHTAVAFPIILRGRRLAVMEFFRRDALRQDDATLELMSAVGGQIGQFIQRIDAQEALRTLNRDLEKRVRERTAALRASTIELCQEIARRMRLEAEILKISEHERRRFGQDLHDDICQQLTGISMLGHNLVQRLQRTGAAEAADAKRMVQLVTEALGDTRDLARGLHPVELDSNGLMAALLELAERTSQEVPCRLECPRAVPVSENAVALNLYRIAQEAVTNTLKHAHARRIVVGLRRLKGQIILSVQDNGAGMPSCRRQGMGLSIMNYRAESMGATLKLDTRPGKGTLITCSVPAHPKKNKSGSATRRGGRAAKARSGK